ncbi:N-formylglutamate amidohydrolase [Allomesorhizobium camelthorni]|uniref:N-formylglutamate amidohydrolase n=1 Tax=Allomesorhizobium camelthorni TaxID=475069 RepID=UPI00197EE965|nr:N-formylglutamate amidohydrolase [Mesorhizobium camelthorni]
MKNLSIDRDPTGRSILDADEPHPLELYNLDGASDFLLICEHAGRMIPRSLGTLGLSEKDRQRHIAWDIGARSVAVALSDRLGGPLFMQRYSRLVCDCNRRPDVPSFVPEISETTSIPGNMNLTELERQARADAIFAPFHAAIAEALDKRRMEGRRTFIVSIHSFTPVFMGVARPWELGVLCSRDRIFAPAIARRLQETTSHFVGINEPYSVGDDTDYAIPVHGEARNLPCAEFEIRNDLIGDAAAAEKWADLLAAVVAQAASEIP